jgi:hypothetical protein
MNKDEIVRRSQLKETLEAEYLNLIDEKINRYLENNRQGITASHQFTPALDECTKLYRDGYFISTVMMSYAINEAIIKLIAEKNNIDTQNKDNTTKTIEELIAELREKNLISANCASASSLIWNSYRNNIHHMNPKVSDIPFQRLAQLNIKHLSAIENEIFGFYINNMFVIPHHPNYW